MWALGNDVVWLERLPQTERALQRLMARTLTPTELAYCRDAKSLKQQQHRLAARLAAKEALGKALGVGLNGLGYGGGIRWQDAEICRAAGHDRPPVLKLYGRAAELATQQNLHTWLVSLAHDGPVAIATVMAVP